MNAITRGGYGSGLETSALVQHCKKSIRIYKVPFELVAGQDLFASNVCAKVQQTRKCLLY